ncbi:hypothetical protein [Pseudomonas entomophila]|uniref:hypothetical protein n=1 Tax=Pseudomonas entomophila TaxID=312306 RepID=UPI001F027C34|nr:hypothetical protein [Pseudomonas entomophila]MCG8296306.1 hypothetical protein [Pseudomonas entomophila]
MVEASALRELNTRLRNNGCIWINAEYVEAGELIRKEVFLRVSSFGFSVGLDHYLDKYEDAADLYIAYLRRDFDSLSNAIDFCVEELSVKVSDFLGC